MDCDKVTTSLSAVGGKEILQFGRMSLGIESAILKMLVNLNGYCPQQDRPLPESLKYFQGVATLCFIERLGVTRLNNTFMGNGKWFSSVLMHDHERTHAHAR